MPILSIFPSGSGDGGGGLTLASVTNITKLVASGRTYVKWTDPSDVVYEGSPLLTWDGTLLVRKAGSMPVSRRDGTVVLDSTLFNRYSEEYFCDSGLTDGTTYYYKFFPYTTTGVYTDSAQSEWYATPTAQVEGIENWLVTGMSASTEAGDGAIMINWTDPAATIEADGVTLATWGCTTVVVKAGSYPTGKDDPDAAYTLRSTTRNQYASTPLVVTGLTNGTEYYIAFYPETTDGGLNTSEAQRTTGTANRITIESVPSQSGTLTYDGNTKTVAWNNYDADKMTLGGVTTGTNAGSYTATFTPAADYRWADGSTEAKEVAWTIGKAAGSLSLSATTVALSADATSATVTVTRAGNGAITATSNNTGVATVSVSGTTLTIRSVNDTGGSATITVQVAEGDNHFAPTNGSIAVTASFGATASTSAASGVSYTSGLSGLSADEVSMFAQAISDNSAITSTTSTVYVDYGSIHRKLSVADQVTLSLNGTNYAFDIVGFNHDTLSSATAYGEATATGKAGITLQMHDIFATTYKMNSSNTNVGGWTSCVMRTSTMATMKGYLPSAWQTILKPVTKRTSAGSQSTTINTTVDSCFLLSEVEIFGSTTYSVSGEGSQYAYYKAGNTKVKNKSGSAYDWWERSPYASYSAIFCYVYSGGSANHGFASDSYGVAFGFCV
ncbi:MAG: DUF6273 domain-containing protein [Eubacteriales bacterium]|nr:DUF6273 domain-containing protein [Eubacteriales bacterium]